MTRLLITLLLISSLELTAQDKPAYPSLSIELEPGLAFVANNATPHRNFGAVRPLLQLNYRFSPIVEPHLRAGYLFTWSRTSEPLQGVIYGVGSRLYFGHHLIKNEAIARDFHLYTFFNFSVANYSVGGEEFFYRLPGLTDRILRLGAGVVFPASRRFSTKVELGYARRSHSLRRRNGSVGAASLIYHLRKPD